MRDLEEELELGESFLEGYDTTLNQLPRQQVMHLRHLMYKVKNVIDTYAIFEYERATAGTCKIPVYWIKGRRFATKLVEFRYRIKEVTESLSHLARNSEDSRFPKSHAPRYLWPFIYYFLLFPADFQVPTRRLIVLWVAEDLIRPSSTEPVEQIAERNLNVLINLGLVLVTKKKLNGKAQACILEDGVREAWFLEAKRGNFFKSRTGPHIRRLVDRAAATDDAFFVRIHGNPNISSSVPDYGDVVSFLSFDTQEGSKPGEDIGNFLDKCILACRFLRLKVLDLERVFRPKLPKSLGRLVRLKYLGLRWTYLERLPDFVSRLLELQVLDVKHTYISVLPRSIWRMRDLRHLYLSESYRTRFPDRPSGYVPLINLQTLWGAFVDEDTCVEDGLDTLASLTNLENLRLKSRDKKGRAADLHLSTLQRNTELTTVYLLGRLNPHVVDNFPVRLADITLSGSEMDVDPMGVLGRLPNLRILRLLARSVLHPRMRCSEGGFPQLKVVYVWNLENLEEWQVEEGSLPCLEEFEIRSCQKLEKLPHQLQCVYTLKKFRLTCMPEGFMHETELTQPLLWAKIQHGPQVNSN
ncbi:hypothetical protein ACS0TY_026029 [Phlomoides rotata]